jgi:citrate lyase beta subunit
MTPATNQRASLDESALAKAMARLTAANKTVAHRLVGEPPDRQPAHTVYGGAHLFKSDTAVKLGESARQSFKHDAPDAATFARAIDVRATDPQRQEWLERTVYERVGAKLAREAVEDFRLDFEDGYGNRPDREEDETAVTAAEEVAKGMAAGTLPPFIGIRVKTLSEELKGRAVRTLDLFVSTLVARTGGKLPANFVVTLPKVTVPEHVAVFAEVLGALEAKCKLPSGALRMEIMIETTLAILGNDGTSPLLAMAAAGGKRVVGAHFGVYDYTASCSVTAAHQGMEHPACDFARHMMKVAYAGQPIWLSDGATNVMPVGPHRAKAGATLTAEQRRENLEVVHRAWGLAARQIRHSLLNAFYQGWDLHPAQLPARYGAIYSFFLDGLEAATARLKAFVDKAAQATLLGDVFDDAATGQGLLNFFLRALSTGAITESEALACGLTLPELQSRSFLKILEGRKKL